MQELLNVSKLVSGDIIFSSSPEAISSVIKRATSSKYSHASIYLRDGVIMESNDTRGVAPRRIELKALAADGSVLGLPYDNWYSITVLRLKIYSSQEWERAVGAALRDHIGMDFPPPSVLAQGGGRFISSIAMPFGKVYELWQWIFNREAIKYDSWCSRLVGRVLSEQMSHRMDEAQRSELRTASPQRLFEIASALGYAPMPECVSNAVEGRPEEFEERARELRNKQGETYLEWDETRDRQRKKILDEVGLQHTRLISKRIGLVAVGMLVILGALALNFRSEFESQHGDYPMNMGALELRTDRHGSDFSPNPEHVDSPTACARLCSQYHECVAMTFVLSSNGLPSGDCWLKNAVPPQTSRSDMTSAVKVKQ